MIGFERIQIGRQLSISGGMVRSATTVYIHRSLVQVKRAAGSAQRSSHGESEMGRRYLFVERQNRQRSNITPRQSFIRRLALPVCNLNGQLAYDLRMFS